MSTAVLLNWFHRKIQLVVNSYQLNFTKFNWSQFTTRACCHYGNGRIFAAILGLDPVFDTCNNALRFILESLDFF